MKTLNYTLTINGQTTRESIEVHEDYISADWVIDNIDISEYELELVSDVEFIATSLYNEEDVQHFDFS